MNIFEFMAIHIGIESKWKEVIEINVYTKWKEKVSNEKLYAKKEEKFKFALRVKKFFVVWFWVILVEV